MYGIPTHPPFKPASHFTQTHSTTDVVDGDVSFIANFIATSGADGKISLREAIFAANNTTGADLAHMCSSNGWFCSNKTIVGIE